MSNLLHGTMAKVTIEFDSIEDKDEMEMCLNGSKWYLVAWELDQYLRKKLKWEKISEETYNELEKTRNLIYELMCSNSITFD
jgi:hypothetical protein